MKATLFKPFEELLGELPRLADRLPDAGRYWGHTPGPQAPAGKLPELLQEHVDRVNQVCLGLVRAHGLEPVVERLIATLLPAVKASNEEWAGNFIKTGFLAAVALHDFGKINENYQLHLGNGQFGRAVPNGIESGHSGLGAFIWLHYALHELDEAGLGEVEADKLFTLTLDFADLILNHHASRLIQKEYEPGKYERLAAYVEKLQLPVVSDTLEQVKHKIRCNTDFYQPKPGETSDYFTRFALLKLCFSLLTASDYLATLGYMQTGGDYTRLDVAELGILSAEDKARFRASFCCLQKYDYNHQALTDTDHWADRPWEELQERSRDNLNELRKKLLATVVRRVRQAPPEPLYYLEAPTGSGKTNLSLAVALELLAHDARLGKVFYVFPFTTLITQTYDDIKAKLNLADGQLVQLHSKAEYASKAQDAEGSYGPQWHNHVDNLFVQYPITLLSHVRFFDVLKSNRKEANYLLHRLANSVVVLDEVQSYSPALWDHVNYFLLHYARQFNIRVVVMSATLPPLHQLTREAAAPPVVNLVAEPERYFQNANFAGRVEFRFELLGNDWRQRYSDKQGGEEAAAVLGELADAVATRCKEFAAGNDNRVAAIIEFITKKSASGFAEEVQKHEAFAGYEVRVLSGTILEPRRREVVKWLKDDDTRKRHRRILLICTQVVEAGVDIDMDLGFKDRSLLDSDEQLAGRVNRNASRAKAPVYLFNLDSEEGIYKGDLRLQVARTMPDAEYQRILAEKDFASFYQRGIDKLNSKDGKAGDTFGDYLQLMRLLDYSAIDYKFQLIDNETQSVFIPWKLSAGVFSESELLLLEQQQCYREGDAEVEGEQVFGLYVNTVKNKSGDFIGDREARQRLQSVMSKFTISVYPQLAEKLRVPTPKMDWNNYGFVYLHKPHHVYSYEEGLLAKGDFVSANIF